MADKYLNSTCGSVTISNEFKWKINNFLPKLEKSAKECISSPVFSVNDAKNNIGECLLQVYPQGVHGAAGYVSIYLYNMSDSTLVFSFVIGIERNDGLTISQTKIDFNDKGKLAYACLSTFLKIEDLKKNAKDLLPGGSLTIKLSILKPDSEIVASRILADFERMYSNMEFADMKIVCGGQTFECHRFILSGRSPYFAAMLGEGFIEGQNREITLNSVDPEILKDMLSFIYSGKIENLNSNAAELLKAGDQFQLDHLKEICGNHLVDELNLENVLDNLMLADRYLHANLKDSAMNFVVENITSLMDTSTWKDINRGYPDLVVETMQTLVRRRIA